MDHHHHYQHHQHFHYNHLYCHKKHTFLITRLLHKNNWDILINSIITFLFLDTITAEQVFGNPVSRDYNTNYDLSNLILKAQELKDRKFLIIHGTADGKSLSFNIYQSSLIVLFEISKRQNDANHRGNVIILFVTKKRKKWKRMFLKKDNFEIHWFFLVSSFYNNQ